MNVMVILDGASEPLHGDAPTSLEAARTPALDELARTGRLSRLGTIPDGLPAGSEVAIPVLLGCPPVAAVARAPVEAAAYEIEVPAGSRAWRVDVVADGRRAGPAATRRAAQRLAAAAPGHVVHRLAGHRLLLVGPAPLPAAAGQPQLEVWPDGETLPRRLASGTVMVAARGAAAGVARLLGATVVAPDGATGGPDSDLAAKAAAARTAIAAGAPRVVIHVGGADEAAHARDRDGKVAFIERADSELIAPIADIARSVSATLIVCPDHGCDPATGRHDAAPVPSLSWPGERDGARRLTEREAAHRPLIDLTVTGVAA